MHTNAFNFPVLLLLFCWLFPSEHLQSQSIQLESSPDEIRWVDSVYHSLSLDERIAQLLVVRANQPNQPYDDRIDHWIKAYNIGGITFFAGEPESQLIQTNRWQQLSKTPLLVTMDAEWGLAMRLKGTVSYPLQMTLGAIQDDRLIGLMGKQIAEQSRRMGIHANFAPVVDVNNNPGNPVIGMRSFGEDPNLVFRKGLAYATALQENGVIATAKHFPGHGDTYLDSHFTLPSITHQREHLEKNELYPFQQLIRHGLGGIMIAHLYMPAFEKEENLAVSLSKNVVTDLLKTDMGFEGLIVTDALDMKGVTNYHPSGIIERKALEAGNDILLLPEDVPLAIATIREAIENGSLAMERLEESCRKVLQWKYRAGLHAYRPAFPENLLADLNEPIYHRLVERLFEEAITLVKNTDAVIPLMPGAGDMRTATLAIGYDRGTSLQAALQEAGLQANGYFLPRHPTKEQTDYMFRQLKSYDQVVISMENTNILANRRFGIDKQSVALVDRLAAKTDVVLSLFASPYALDFFENTDELKAILIAYQERGEASRASADILMGKRNAKGQLPVSVGEHFPLGTGLQINLTEAPDEAENLLKVNQTVLQSIDSVIIDGIQQKAYPGCQVIASVDGELIYHKSFGKHVYEGTRHVLSTDVYDVASLTKILATTLAVMKLYEDGLLKLTDVLGDYFPYLRGTDKENIKLIDILTHQSGFDGWIPFFMETISDEGPDPNIYADAMSVTHPYRVAEGLYMHRDYKNIIFNEIRASEMKSTEYRYSDLGFYFIPEIIEKLTNQSFENYVREHFYQPMGLRHTLFQPLRELDKDQIVPTENDQTFRKQLLHGDVHDQGTAMLGGVSGHAGLFSNAIEVHAIMEMLLNEGSLNGHQYLKPETIAWFNTAHFRELDNRRGIGFDKPPLNNPRFRTPAEAASSESFGHTGFTGTFAWADPANKLIVVFLSNRVYPDSNNNGLSRMNIRTYIHELFYEAIAVPEAQDEISALQLAN